MSLFSENFKTKSTTLFFILFIILVYSFFPINTLFQQFIVMVVFLIILPEIYSIFFLKEIKESKNKIKWIYIQLILITILIGITIYFLVFKTPFIENYHIPSETLNKFNYFIYYELIFNSFLVIIYSYFFIKFIYFNLEKIFNPYISVIIQSLIVIIIVFLSKSDFWVALPFIIFAPFSGLIAMKTRSFYYPMVAQFLFILILDVLYLKLSV